MITIFSERQEMIHNSLILTNSSVLSLPFFFFFLKKHIAYICLGNPPVLTGQAAILAQKIEVTQHKQIKYLIFLKKCFILILFCITLSCLNKSKTVLPLQVKLPLIMPICKIHTVSLFLFFKLCN